MAICPNEHMHFLLHALKSQDRASTSIYLAELVLWLLVPSNRKRSGDDIWRLMTRV